jgi:fluoride exporter
MTLNNILMVGLGGGLGSIARFISVKTLDSKLNSVFPYGTLTVNVVGSFVLGMVYVWLSKKPGFENWSLFLGAGVCGGFTTFSAFTLENLNLIAQRQGGTAMLYIGVSLLAGILAVAGGAAVGQRL